MRVHPVVIFNILDQFLRRSEGQDRVIGTLLGLNVDGVIEIRNCFPVPHTEGEQVHLILIFPFIFYFYNYCVPFVFYLSVVLIIFFLIVNLICT